MLYYQAVSIYTNKPVVAVRNFSGQALYPYRIWPGETRITRKGALRLVTRKALEIACDHALATGTGATTPITKGA